METKLVTLVIKRCWKLVVLLPDEKCIDQGKESTLKVPSLPGNIPPRTT